MRKGLKSSVKFLIISVLKCLKYVFVFWMCYVCLQVIKKKKEEMNSGDKNYIESSVNPEENSVSATFKPLKDDLDEQDENDVGKCNAAVPATTASGMLLSLH